MLKTKIFNGRDNNQPSLNCQKERILLSDIVWLCHLAVNQLICDPLLGLITKAG